MFKPSDLPSLQGRIFLVTGGNTGIGYATCLNLAAKNVRVYIGARSLKKAEEAVAKIKESHPQADLHVLILDHTSLSSVVSAAETFKRQEKKLHGLILNAGIMAVPYEITKDGFESQMQVNYLAHWVLTRHLLPTLLATAQTEPGTVRIACVSSEGHKTFGTKVILYGEEDIKNAGPFGRYGLSKLANVIHAKNLNEQYGPGSASAKTGNGEIWTASLNPGFIATQLNEKNRDRASWKLSWIHPVLIMFGIMRPWDEGCISSLYVGVSPEFRGDMSGSYFDHKMNIKQPNPSVNDAEERRKLETWTIEKTTAGGWI